MIPAIANIELVGGPLDGEVYAITINEVGAQILFPLNPHIRPMSCKPECPECLEQPVLLRHADYRVTSVGIATYQGES